MKKALENIKKITILLFVIITVAMMIFTILSVSTLDRNNRSLFGYKFFIVTSNSMASTDFKAGDIVIVQSIDPSTLKAGDIITFSSQDPKNFGATVTHKIRSLSYDLYGNPGFVTYGTTNNQDDEAIVTPEYIIGKYRAHIPKLGSFCSFFKTPTGYIVCILLPFSLLLISFGADCVRLFLRYKKEQEDLLKAAQEENQRMKTELVELKAKLAKHPSEDALNSDLHDDITEKL